MARMDFRPPGACLSLQIFCWCLVCFVIAEGYFEARYFVLRVSELVVALVMVVAVGIRVSRFACCVP